MQTIAQVTVPTAMEPMCQKITPVGDFLNSSDVCADPVALNQRLLRDGYLFIRGLLDPKAIAEVRRDILKLCKDSGWIRPGTKLMNAVFHRQKYVGGDYPDYQQEYMPLYRRIIQLESFNALTKHPSMMHFFSTLFQAEVLAHPRTIARVSFPGNTSFTTQPHQDWFYIKGAVDTYTSWIPLGDCPRKLGGLAILEKSHALGVLKHSIAVGAGGNGLSTAHLQLRWLSADYHVGDVVIFHSHTVHGALDNCSKDHLRLSVDYRYQRATDPVDPDSLQPHNG